VKGRALAEVTLRMTAIAWCVTMIKYVLLYEGISGAGTVLSPVVRVLVLGVLVNLAVLGAWNARARLTAREERHAARQVIRPRPPGGFVIDDWSWLPHPAGSNRPRHMIMNPAGTSMAEFRIGMPAVQGAMTSDMLSYNGFTPGERAAIAAGIAGIGSMGELRYLGLPLVITQTQVQRQWKDGRVTMFSEVRVEEGGRVTFFEREERLL
jgi:hypothetical protein